MQDHTHRVFATSQVTPPAADAPLKAFARGVNLKVIVFDVPMRSWQIVHAEAVLNMIRRVSIEVTPPAANTPLKAVARGINLEALVFDVPMCSWQIVYRQAILDVVSWVSLEMAPPMTDATRKPTLEASIFDVPVATWSVLGGSAAPEVIFGTDVAATLEVVIAYVLRRRASRNVILVVIRCARPSWLLVLLPMAQQGASARKVWL